MEQNGVIVEEKGEYVVVEVRRHASCENCGACGLGKVPIARVEARNLVGARLGDSVIIELEARSVYSASFIVYLLPLVAMLIGFGLGGRIAQALGISVPGDLASAITGVVLLCTAFLGVHLYDRKVGRRRYVPVVSSIVSRPGAGE